MGLLTKISLSGKSRSALESVIRKPSAPAGHVRRCQVVLMSADGVSASEISDKLSVTRESVSRIRKRFADGGVDALSDAKRSGRTDHAVSDEVVEELIGLALAPPPAGRSRWTTRLLASELGLSSSIVSRLLRQHELKPHLSRTYKVSRDPNFAEKVRDVVGLYLNPPSNAIVLSVDEKTSIQALERTQPPLPMRKGRASRHTHDYKRHGVIDLYAALDVATGLVTHKLTKRHTATDFIGFMRKVVQAYPGEELHVVLDNSSSHNTEAVREWLAQNPQVQFHFTPTSASWLNQVEGFFGILTKQSLTQTGFPSKKALKEHINAYLKGWNQRPSAFEWTKPANAIIKSHERQKKRLLEETT